MRRIIESIDRILTRHTVDALFAIALGIFWGAFIAYNI